MVVCVSKVLKHGPRSFELAFFDLHNNGKQLCLMVMTCGYYKFVVCILKLFKFGSPDCCSAKVMFFVVLTSYRTQNHM
jgi:hypothetical protein